MLKYLSVIIVSAIVGLLCTYVYPLAPWHTEYASGSDFVWWMFLITIWLWCTAGLALKAMDF